MKSRAIPARALWLSLFFLVATARAAITPPDVLVRTTAEGVLSAIARTSGRDRLQEMAETTVLPHFDFKRMTALAVGAPWKQASPEQQQALENGFRELLVRTYTTALASGAQMKATLSVDAPRMQPDGNEAVVGSRVTAPGSPPIRIDYYMQKQSSGWKVYDVVVEGVSLVTNYRQTFSAQVASGGIDGLIAALAQKNGAPAGQDTRTRP